jgi:aspartate kinase
MKIFKFGGASVQNAEGIRNVASILQTYHSEKLLVVVSAMGKTTNMLEKLVEAYFYQNTETREILTDFKAFHLNIVQELEKDGSFPVIHEIENLFLELECFIETPLQQEDFDFIYDQIVPFGELISTKILSNYLLSLQLKNQWLDSRNFILTDNRYRDSRIHWKETEQIIKKRLAPLLEKNLVITQGFIGRGPHNENTTLGREGSDYSAAIFAYCLEAQSVSIWKDVAGVMNADPKKFSNATLISQLGYSDAIELAYYGASVIHPKTIQPLRAKNIPLHVKSFINPNQEGTTVSNRSEALEVPCYIHKSNQSFIQLSTRDFTFIVEENLQKIFSVLAEYKIRTNIISNSAISFSFAAEISRQSKDKLLLSLEALNLSVQCTDELQLLTIYNFNEEKGIPVKASKFILEQINANTRHYLY